MSARDLAATVREALLKAASSLEFRESRQPWVDDALDALAALEKQAADAQRPCGLPVRHLHQAGGGHAMSAARDERDQTIASAYIGVRVSLANVDWALGHEDLLAEAFEQAQEAVKRVLVDGRFAVEMDT